MENNSMHDTRRGFFARAFGGAGAAFSVLFPGRLMAGLFRHRRGDCVPDPCCGRMPIIPFIREKPDPAGASVDATHNNTICAKGSYTPPSGRFTEVWGYVYNDPDNPNYPSQTPPMPGAIQGRILADGSTFVFNATYTNLIPNVANGPSANNARVRMAFWFKYDSTWDTVQSYTFLALTDNKTDNCG
jgi:hypothetical protein